MEFNGQTSETESCSNNSNSNSSSSSNSSNNNSILQTSRVRFAENTEVFLFDRQRVFDRIPICQLGDFKLGMTPTHFEHLKSPTGTKVEKRPMTAWRGIPARERELMLPPTLPEYEEKAARLERELEEIHQSRRARGCTCLGRCLPESCQCIQAGVECNLRGSIRNGACRCPNPQCGNEHGRRYFHKKKMDKYRAAVIERTRRRPDR